MILKGHFANIAKNRGSVLMIRKGKIDYTIRIDISNTKILVYTSH